MMSPQTQQNINIKYKNKDMLNQIRYQPSINTLHHPMNNMTRYCPGKIEAGCEYTNQVMDVLKYYQTLDLENEINQQIMIKYFHQKTSVFLDDYTHFITKHLNDVYQQTTNFDINECNFVECPILARHHRDKEIEQTNREDQQLDDDFIFYRDIMDSLHCTIYHQYDEGLRMYRRRSYPFIHQINDMTQITARKSLSDIKEMLTQKALQPRYINTKRYHPDRMKRYQQNKFQLNINSTPPKGILIFAL